MVKFLCAISLLSMVFTSCSKSPDVSPRCEGLITDTAGTNDSAKLFVPNAFSPNGDAQNDLFRVVGNHIASVDIQIFDGNNVVYTSQSLQEGWSLNPGLNTYKRYTYRVQAITLANHKISSCGDLFLANCFPPNASASSYRFLDQLTSNGFTNPSYESMNNVCR